MLQQKPTNKNNMLKLRTSALMCALALLLGLSWAMGRPAAETLAATNGTVNFQARLQTAAGNLVPDGFYNVEFKLYNASTSSGSSQGSCVGDSNCLWVETRTGGSQVRVVNGYLTVNLGSVSAFGSVNWDQELWLTMNVGGTGSPAWDGEMTPRLKLTAVPYAFRAGQLALQTGTNSSILGWGSQTASNSILLPDDSGTICLQSASNCGFVPGTNADFIQNQNSSAQSAADFWISGTGRANALQTLSLDTATAAALNIGAATASSVTIGGTTNTPVTIQSGDGTITIGGGSQTGSIAIGTGTGVLAINLGTGGTGAKTVTVGSTASASSLTLQSGGTVSIDGGGSVDITASDLSFYTNGGHLWQDVEYNGTTSWQLLNNQSGNAYFAFQNYNGQNVLYIDGENDTVRLGQAFGSFSGSLLFHGSDTGNEITLQSSDVFDSYSLTLPTGLGSTGDCLKQQDGAGQLVFTACGAESGTLQGAYNASVGGATPEIKVDSTRGAFDIQDADATIGGTLFNVRGSNASGLGDAFFSVNSSGLVGIGTDTQERQLDLVVDNSTTNAPPLRVKQQGSGDASLEFQDGSGRSFFAGIDASDSSTFKIASSTSANTTTTAGYSTTAGMSHTGTDLSNDIGATKVTTGGTGGTVSSISVYTQTVDGSSAGGEVALYADNSGTPGTLIASSGTQNLTSGWTTFPLSASVNASTTYWLALNVEGAGTSRGYWDTGGEGTAYYDSMAFGSWPDLTSVSPSSSNATQRYPLHMTIAPAGAVDSFNGIALLALSDTGAATFRNSVDSAVAFGMQNAAGTFVLTTDTLNGRVVLGSASELDGSLQFLNATNVNAVTLQSGVTSGSYTLTLPTALGGSGDCLVDTDGSGALGFTNCDNGDAFIQGGNAFGETAVLGTTDSNGLSLLTNGSTVLSLSGVNGAATFQNSADSSSALRVSNSSGNSVLTVDTSSGQVFLGAPNTVSGTLVFSSAGGSNTTTLQTATPSANQFITLPNASGTVCLTSGNCSGVGGNGDILQGGNTLGTDVILGSNDNNDLLLETNDQTRLTIDTSGNVAIGGAASGDRLSVTSAIDNATIVVDDDFDPSIDGAEWASTSNATTDTVCGAAGSVSGNALRFNGNGTRSAATIDMDSSNGGTISFYLYTSNQGTTGCENTEGGEDVILEYSNNGGGNWTTINTYDENAFTTITQVEISIPVGAQTSSTRFRWRQVQHSGSNFDNWTLDNVFVATLDSANAPSALYVYNNSSSTEVDLLRLSSDVGGTADIKFRVTADGDVYADGTFYGAGGVTAGSADLAEVYRNHDNAQPGDVVVFADSRTVEKSSKPYQAGLAGVVSTQPGFTLNVNEIGVPVALSGRVPVKVSVENGAIQKGDYLTSGPDGKAQKASAAGPTIGTALEDVAEDGTIEVFVHLGYYDPVDDALFQNNVLLTLQSSDVTVGNLNVSGEIVTETLRVSGNAYIGGELEVGVAKITSTLTVGGRIISKGEAVTPEVLLALGYTEPVLAALPNPPVAVDGTDTAGTVTFTAGNNPASGELLRIAFSAQYEAHPRVVLEPSNADGAHLQTYVTKTRDGFVINAAASPEAGKTYSFDYIIIGSEVVSAGQ